MRYIFNQNSSSIFYYLPLFLLISSSPLFSLLSPSFSPPTLNYQETLRLPLKMIISPLFVGQTRAFFFKLKKNLKRGATSGSNSFFFRHRGASLPFSFSF